MDENISEIILTERKALEYTAKDEDIVKLVDDRISEANKKKSEIDKKAAINEKYWRGEQLDTTKIPDTRAKIVDNKIFQSLETMLPILTANVPQPEIQGEIDNNIRSDLQDLMKIHYEIVQTIPQKLREFIRNWAIGYVGVLKYRWEKGKGMTTEVVNWRKIGFDPVATRLQDADFVFEYQEDTITNLVKRFPKAKRKIKEKYPEDKWGSKVRYVEFWGNGGEWVCWKLEKIILDKKKNPNWSYTSKDNILQRPIFPYLVGNYFRTNRSIYDETSVIEVAKPIQDAINKRKNQISDMCDQNKRCWVASSVAINREDFQKFINKFGEKGVYVEGGDITQIQQLLGKMDMSYYNDLQHSIAEIDNIFGTHSTTRGERQGRETATGRQVLFQADISRMSGIVEDVVEQVIEDWYNTFLHMNKVFSKSGINYNNGKTDLNIPKEAIPEGIFVLIKKGTSAPLDRGSRIQMAQQLGQQDRIDPQTQFEEMGYPKPEERAQKLIDWKRLEGVIPPAPEEQEAAQKQDATDIQDNQLMKIQNIIKSEEFQNLPPEDQEKYLAQAREITNNIKGGE